MTIIPCRKSDQVKTDQMGDTEAASSIPPWPVDISSRPSAVETDPIEGAGAVVVPLLVMAAVCCAALVAVLL